MSGYRADARSADHAASGLALAALLALAMAVRLFFYTGFFGSDELTYVESALRIAAGDFTPSSYIGAIRYGLQLPMAGFAALFGPSESALNLWPFLCSMVEVALVATLGRHLVGTRAALIAGLVLAVLPLHVHFAGRLMADAPLALCLTASFLLFWRGQQRDSTQTFLLAGLAAGLSFWVKEVTTLYLAVFLAYPLLFRCWNWKWLWMLGGFALMVGANLLLFFVLTGDPLYVLRIAGSAAADYAASSGRFAGVANDSAATYYLDYFFLKVYHSWLLGPLALIGLACLWRQRGDAAGSGGRFVALWAIGLLALFSLLPVSLHPLKLISKQVNYMLMFAAPLALLAAVFISRLRGAPLGLALALIVLPSLLLGALERNTVAVFTANGKGAVELARKLKAEDQVYGPVSAEKAAYFDSMVRPGGDPVKILLLADLLEGKIQPAAGRGIIAIVDPQPSSPEGSLVPACWQALGPLQAVTETRLSGLFHAMARAAGLLPGSLGSKVAGKLTELVEPAPAQVYRIPDASQVRCPG